jgi:hypothetical protein
MQTKTIVQLNNDLPIAETVELAGLRVVAGAGTGEVSNARTQKEKGHTRHLSQQPQADPA